MTGPVQVHRCARCGREIDPTGHGGEGHGCGCCALAQSGSPSWAPQTDTVYCPRLGCWTERRCDPCDAWRWRPSKVTP